MKKSSFVYGLVVTALVFCFGAVSAQSQNVYYVRAGATGSGNGSDWNNAYTSLPSSLQRGATYYIAAGTYPSYTFADPQSGTSVITIKKAIASDHGTDTGWQSSYAGQAIFNSTLQFLTGYYVFDGQTRDENNWTDGTAYGFQVANNGQDENIILRTQNNAGSVPANNITIQYVFVNAIYGNLPTSTTIRRYAVDTETFNNSALHTGLVFQRMYVYGSNQHWYLRQSNGSLVQYCASRGIVSNSANHGENVNLYFSSPNATIRYNVFLDSFTDKSGNGGTAVIALTESDGAQIYGNYFYNFYVGDAVIGFNGDTENNALVYNNTIVGGTGLSAGIVLGTGSGNYAYNNLWVNNSATVNFGNVTHDYNAFSGSSANGEAHGQSGLTTSIFVNYAATNLTLTGPTTAGITLSAPYNTDMLGNIRGADGNWDRGAYEYTGVVNTNPPVISNPGSASVTAVSAVIGWTTDKAANSVVRYGLTSAYGLTVSDSSLVTTHSVSLLSLTPSTLFHYQISSTDGSGNTSTSADATFTTAAADTTPPTVTLTAPANGLTVSNTVNLTATASDNVGVVGVKFFVNGTQVMDSTSAPYSYLWDSVSVANGAYSIYAQARDAAGNTTWSATNIVTVNNAAGALPSPVAYWSFNEGTGTTAADSVSTNTLTLRTGASWTTGVDGTGLLLDGVSGRADAPNSPALDISGSAITVAAWVNLQDQGTWQQLVAKVSSVGSYTSPYFAWHLFGGSVSATQWRPQFQLVNSGGTSVNVSSSIAVNYGDWVYVVGIYDGSSIYIYVNGVLQGSATQSGSILSVNQPLYIGANGLPGEFAKGTIDKVAIYSEALSASQIQTLYNSNLPPAPTGLHIQSF